MNAETILTFLRKKQKEGAENIAFELEDGSIRKKILSKNSEI